MLNPSSTSTVSMTPIFTDSRQRNSNLRSKIMRNEEQRLELEQKLRAMTAKCSQLHQRRQIQHIQSYFTRLNQESQRAEQRNLNLLQDLTQAQERLEQLHNDAEHLMRLKNDYLAYLESHYPKWQRPTSTQTSIDMNDQNHAYSNLARHLRQPNDQLESYGNLRNSAAMVRNSRDSDASMLVKRYADQLNRHDRTMSPPIGPGDSLRGREENNDEPSIAESNDSVPIFAQGKRSGSLRMELSTEGLYFLLDYLDRELKDVIDKHKIYRNDQTTISQKREILEIANKKQQDAVQDLDPATTTMVILDKLPSIVRRATVNKCLLTTEILSANVKDLDRDVVASMLPEKDRFLWLRLTAHFGQLLKLHIMNSQVLADKFAVALLPDNALYVHEKGKSLMKHLIDKYVRTQSSNSDDEFSVSSKKSLTHVSPINPPLSSSLLKKLNDGEDDFDDHSNSSSLKIKPQYQSTKKPTDNDEDSAADFFSNQS